MRTIAITLLALLSTACARVCCPEGAGTRAVAPARVFLLVEVTLLETPAGEGPQVLIESRAISTAPDAPLPALAQAERIDAGRVPVWLGGSHGEAVGFGPGAQVLAKPAIVTRSGEQATIFVGESGGGGLVPQGNELTITPEVSADGAVLALTLAYTQYRGGRIEREIPATTVAVPTGRTLVLEALPAR